MLPVVVGERQARWHILAYTLLLVAVTWMLFVTGSVGWIYLAGATALGAGFVFLAGQTIRDHGVRWSRRLFDYSIIYLALLFGVIVVDRMVIT
jgi:protoheme IX farnesyltransferase